MTGTTDDRREPDPLVVRLTDRSAQTLAAPGTYVVGRGGDVDLGSDLEMHREVAVLSSLGGRWFIGNLLDGKRLTISPRGTSSAGPVSLLTGEDVQVPVGLSRATFRLGAALHAFDLTAPDPAVRLGSRSPASARTETRAAELEISLTPVTRLLAIAMAELQLVDARSRSIPTRVEVCARLGWSDKQYERALDRLCESLARAGVSGVMKADGVAATHRQSVAVDTLLDNQVITFDDLKELDAY